MSINATVKWNGAMQFVARAGNGPAVIMDTPDGGSGPTPMEMILFGVAGCTAIDVVAILEKKRLDVTGLDVDISGERAEEDPRRFTDIRIEYRLRGRNIKPKALEQAIALSEEKYCSAIASLNASVTHTYRITEETP